MTGQAMMNELLVHALASFRDDWASHQLESVKRLLEQLDRESSAAAKRRVESGHSEDRRKSTRSAYRTQLIIFLPELKNTQQPLHTVFGKDLSADGICFFSRCCLNEEKMIVFLRLAPDPLCMEGEVLRRRQVTTSLWEYVVKFTRRLKLTAPNMIPAADADAPDSGTPDSGTPDSGTPDSADSVTQDSVPEEQPAPDDLSSNASDPTSAPPAAAEAALPS